ncbi:Uncharacterized protein Adt_25432 [Abeliophyllum distichum]|uniref:Uncharacterized protein n=1 Tax=Abeliophyllum distichum TaxID=126358 RepID=A0ABD1SJM8_9LAMI
MVLVESEEMNTYAWGKELFGFTISSLRPGLKNKSQIIEGDDKPYIAYTLSGFLIAFQIWIYETIPILEGKICTKVGDNCPRILNWTSRVQGNVSTKLNIATDIFGRPNLQVTALTPTNNERQQAYSSGIYDDVAHARVEDSDDDFVACVVRRSPRLKTYHQGIASSNYSVTGVKRVKKVCHRLL